MPDRAFDRSELLSLLVRTAVASAITYLGVKWAVDMMDPTRKRRQEDKKRAERLMTRLGIDKNVHLTDYEMSIACQLVEPVSIQVSWDSIAGLDSVIQELKETVILPIQNRHLFRGSQLIQPPKGVLLHGPPGCGKTLLAKATAREACTRFINLEISSLTDKWYGESQKLCAAVFSLAVKLEPCIIFIDEIDSFLRARATHDHEATAMMKAMFMSLWDGLISDSERCVLVMGATNRPQDVDKAILRRMPAAFHIGKPTLPQRKSILHLVMRGESASDDIDFNRLAKLTDGFTGSDLRELCRTAAIYPVRDYMTSPSATVFGGLSGAGPVPDGPSSVTRELSRPPTAQLRPITQADFDRAISKMKESKSHTGGLLSTDDMLD
ncbi:outer mitochondrial transmembrane helix translocase-like [Amphibalanus amphitrite]|uniref:outer mitochondrial transmembrane helix translocase-like n=1 Tax=Amphibalanus amphitrite TaxID=1232801 RepID=UPI001C914A44|nr:outer mitochondrial transmembrane helix translocase-like [Amphibalanus amphitrite]XP_043197490.1 outer mitochondrial transmembrane helix translocase-like [Amphibalanus amphitrite]XP_043197491.1 outer mitochondrial transmembrane helix translocase-like [Amphibalanus amphitrite]XP_043197492.1 outer mitochondrial transmembrane helix translocase-like [Amphibalanus amphitrite]XP_043197493.1 outer mitochondrial transmembrane helix translocase-like [Amphibalanus amphitrite]XP_043197494.1 outer mito